MSGFCVTHKELHIQGNWSLWSSSRTHNQMHLSQTNFAMILLHPAGNPSYLDDKDTMTARWNRVFNMICTQDLSLTAQSIHSIDGMYCPRSMNSVQRDRRMCLNNCRESEQMSNAGNQSATLQEPCEWCLSARGVGALIPWQGEHLIPRWSYVWYHSRARTSPPVPVLRCNDSDTEERSTNVSQRPGPTFSEGVITPRKKISYDCCAMHPWQGA